MNIFTSKLSRTIMTAVLTAAISYPAMANKKVDKGDSFPGIKLGFLEKSGKFSDKNLKGKVVIVDFWAQWCEPCKVALPFMNTLYKKYKKDGLVVVGINVDDEIDKAKGFLKDHPVEFPILHDKEKKMVESVKVTNMPTSFILDRKGVVQYVHREFHAGDSEKQYTEQVKKLLGLK